MFKGFDIFVKIKTKYNISKNIMNILIISPTPTHPQNAGNRSRIFEMCLLLRQRGFLISFLNLKKEEGDVNEMKSFFGNNYYEYEVDALKKRFSINTITHKIRKAIPTANYKYNRKVDFYYDNQINIFLKNTFRPNQFSHVLVEYVVYSKALEYFDVNTTKIIDTHDVLSNRYQLFLEQKIKPQWYSLFPKEEAKGLNRADKIIAIQNHEKEYFEKITSKQITVIGHYTQTSLNSTEPESDTLLFVGSNNKINIDGINHFIKNVFPKIVLELPNIKLIIAGSINKDISKVVSHPNCYFYGEYKNNAEIYSKANVVIIPILYGTGLKIKTIDALANSKAVVSYSEGIFGIENNPDKPIYLLAKNDFDFAQNIISIFKNNKLKTELEMNAFEFMQDYNKDIVKGILSL